MTGTSGTEKAEDRCGKGTKVTKAHSGRSLLQVMVGALVVLTLVVVGVVAAHMSGFHRGPDTNAGRQGSAVPVGNEARVALQAVPVKPSKADAQGGIVVGQQGVGKLRGTVPTIDIYMDFLCPPCGNLHRTLDTSLFSMVKAGQINLGIHFMDFLDRVRSDEYSTRAASAATTVAQEDPDHFLEVVASFYQSDFQPEEKRDGEVSDSRLAERMVSLGVPQTVARRAAGGEYKEWVRKVNAYTLTRSELRNPDGDNKGRMTTPTVTVNGHFLRISHIKPGPDAARTALCRAIGLDPGQVGKADELPSIGGGGKPFDI
ncbi:DsbA family protein [Bifidobacterium xylocopae]|nr:thioredoxin domain-containing protein [Bifidobacterium xylocopae]